MPEDFLNGLNIVPRDAEHAILSATTVSAEHPWRKLFQERAPPPDHSSGTPNTHSPPFRYAQDKHLEGPTAVEKGRPREVKPHETIRLFDVEAFRNKTAQKCLAKANDDQVDEISAKVAQLSTTSSPISRPVIYRYIDVIKNSMALLEAIHFELFMPDRPDLRFLAVAFESLPSGTIEGDFFRIPDADLLTDPSFAAKMSRDEFPVMWEAKGYKKMEFPLEEEHDELAYIMKKKPNTRIGEVEAIIANREISIQETLFPDADSRRRGALAGASDHEEDGHCSSLPGRAAPSSAVSAWLVDSFSPSLILHFLDSDEADDDDFDPRSEYLKRVYNVHTSSQRSGRVVSAMRELDASEAEGIEDRLGAFTKYGEKGDLELMDELFRLGSRFRVHASRKEKAKDVGDIRIDESIILKTITDEGIGNLEECRSLLDCVYGYSQDDEFAPSHRLEQHTVKYVDGSGGLTLNEQQSHAVRLYADEDGPRVFCILSPPGSGKTTVAAAMAAEVGRTGCGRQLLLSVQNVAVDNMGDALKKLEHGRGRVYNMKSTKKLDPHNPAPFDFFDQMGEYQLAKWKNDEIPMYREEVRRPNSRKLRHTELVYFQSEEERLTFHRREFEKGLHPDILLSTVEMMLHKMYTCVGVRRVIIDEASLLTESALYCIIRRFPEARIVLIGDEHQLPPFMYEKNILGHELAGRPALTVAMKTGRVPVVELNEVYRAPPSLIAPYNRLAYGGRLVSRKDEGETPLSDIGLIHSGLPQLLLIDVNGREQHNKYTKSLYNKEELEVLVRLLKKFPQGSAKEIMIICLYKDQKKRLQEILHNQYTVLTVDSAQGKEKAIVILMTTRTAKANDFFRSIERCNVSVSRQQKALIILGKAPLLTTNKPWSTVVNGDDFTQINANYI